LTLSSEELISFGGGALVADGSEEPREESLAELWLAEPAPLLFEALPKLATFG
jgi:hypothetical protein